MADSHSNKDMPFDSEILRQLEGRVEKMTAEGSNTITAGMSGETPIWEYAVNGFLVRKLPDDPLCIRISIGRPNGNVPGNYVVVRGDYHEACEVIERALGALRGVPQGPRGA
jgi:hypothetical protein